MRVIALREFNDKKENAKRREGDVFTVSKERYEEIMAYMPDLIAEYAPEQEQEKKPAPKRRSSRKAKASSAEK